MSVPTDIDQLQDIDLPAVQTPCGLWTPATAGEVIAFNLGWTTGMDMAAGRGDYDRGRRDGYRAGREGMAGDLAVGLRQCWTDLTERSTTDAVMAALARPWGDIRSSVLNDMDRVERRREWDRQNRRRVTA